MRSPIWARWATCAIAISLCVPAFADKHKSVAECTAFDQQEKGDDAVQLSIHNSCSIPVDCQLQWRVVCAPDSKKRRAVHPGTRAVTIKEGAEDSALASAAVCEEDTWLIDSVQWTCAPSKE
jgi:hypothetical protein